MQVIQDNFTEPILERYSSLQSCIRTNDIDFVGDGSHLTYFEMLGNFSFQNYDYSYACLMWNRIIRELHLPVSHITVHPTQQAHSLLWKEMGYFVVEDESCVWSNGNIGGYCCEVFCDDLEVGNLVNPLEHSVDVGFGFERLVQVYEGKERVDDTSLFDTSLPYILRDHLRALTSLYNTGISPGAKGPNSICRQLVRRILPFQYTLPNWLTVWIEREKRLIEQKQSLLIKYENQFVNKSFEYWYQTYGLTEEEITQYLSSI